MGRKVVLKMNDGKWVSILNVESVDLIDGRKRFNIPLKDTSMLADFFRNRKGGV